MTSQKRWALAALSLAAASSWATAASTTDYVGIGSSVSASPVDLSLAASYTTNATPGVNDVVQFSTGTLGTGSNYFTFDSGFTVGQLRVDLPTGSAAGGSETITSANTIILNGTGGNLGVGTGGILLNSGVGATLTVNAPIQLGATQYFTASRALVVGGNINLNGFNLYTDAAGSTTTVTYAGNITDGTGTTTTGLTIYNAGQVILSGTNTYAGGTTLGVSTTGAIVRVANGSALGSGNVTFAVSSTLGTAIGASAVTIPNNIVLSAGTGTLDSTNGTLGVKGNISGAGSLNIVGSNTVALGGTNSNTGGTFILQGTLDATAGVLGGVANTNTIGSAVGDAGNIVFGGANANATLVYATSAGIGAASQIRFRNTGGTAGSGGDLSYVGTTAQTVSQIIENDSSVGMRLDSNSVGGAVTFNGSFAFPGSVSSGRPLYLGGTGTGSNTLAMAYSDPSSSFKGVLTKTGTGEWILGATNTYSGATNINAGTLVVNGSTTASSAANVAVGALLAGTGSVNGTVAVSGTITGGTGIGTLDTPGTLSTGTESWNTGGTYLAKVNSTDGKTVAANDTLVLAGIVLPTSGTFNLAVTSTGKPLTLQPTTAIILADDTDGTASNAFAPANLAATIATLNLTFSNISASTGETLNYTDAADSTTGYELILGEVQSTPEPASLAILAFAAPMFLARRRRRFIAM